MFVVAAFWNISKTTIIKTYKILTYHPFWRIWHDKTLQSIVVDGLIVLREIYIEQNPARIHNEKAHSNIYLRCFEVILQFYYPKVASIAKANLFDEIYLNASQTL